MASVLLIAMMSKPSGISGWRVMVLVIHGENYGPIYDAWRGEPLPSAIAADTCVVVPPGHVFLATAAPSSLDSRYYGSVAVERISAIATPLFTCGVAQAAWE